MFIPALSKYTLAGLLLGIFFLPADVRADSSTAVPSQEREAVKGGLHDQVDKGLPIIGGSLSLGLALITETALYRGVDDKVWLQPVFIYDNGAFHLQAYEGVNTAYDFYDRDRLKFSLFGELATEGFDAGDSPALAGMSEPDMVASLGFVGSFQTDFAEVELVAVNDVTGEHDGQKIELHVKTMLPFQGAFFIPEITATYLSEEVTDYYYGVSAAESRPDRPTYSPDQAVNIKIGLLVRYPLFKGFNLISMVENTWYDQAITDSPLVGEESRFLATVGILYTF